MAAKRKTFKVDEFRKAMNEIIANSADFMTRERICIAVILEDILMETGNYHGFGYIDISDTSHPNFDDSRRVYFGG